MLMPFVHKTSVICGALSVIIMGIVVLFGWYTQTSSLIQILPQFTPMQFNTALCFLLCGLGLILALKHLNHLSLACGVLVLLLSTLTLIQYITGFNFGIDQLFVDAHITTNTSYPGRMSPNTAFCFIFIAITLILLPIVKGNQLANIITEMTEFLTLAISGIALLGYLVGNEYSYTWGVFTQMALHTAIGFLILGLCFLVTIWYQTAHNIASVPLWIPSLLFVGVLYFDVLTPLGVAAGIAYVPLIFFSLKFYDEKASFMLATLATFMTLFGYILSTSIVTDVQHVILNRLLSGVAIWVTAIVIYQHKITQKKLLKSEEALNLGWQGAGDGMWDWDILSNKVIFSDRFLELLGYKPNEIKFHFDEWANRLHKEDKEHTLAVLDSHIKNKTPYDIEYRLLTKSGEWRWYLAKGQALWDKQCNPIRMAGSLSDITERKKIEIELHLLKLSVDNSKDVVLITEANLDNPIIVYASKATFELCGYSPEDMIGKIPAILQGENTDKDQLKALKNALYNNEPFSTELLNYAKDGREYWIDIHIVPVINEQGITTHFAAIERDITQNKLSEIEQERLILALGKSNQELDEFAYVASHDLKAPLRVIHNAANWLEEDLAEKLDDESKENLQLLRSRVIRMEKLLDDLLDYSRIGRKLNENYQETISGAELFNVICELLSSSVGFNIKTTDEFLALQINRMPLQQVLLNLVSNAIKHHDKTEGEIMVSVEQREDQYLISVTDDGPGIAEQFHQRVFKMFQTLKPRDQVEGSGMGLAVVRKHIEHFGGTITLESAEGQGCTFKFTWPVKQDEYKEKKC